MASNKALDDDQVILMAWEVAVRRGWAFVIDTLLRGGIELFPPDSSGAEETGFWERVGGGTQQEPLASSFKSTTDCSTVMASQESGDEEEEALPWDIGSSWPTWSGHGLNTSLVTRSSSHEKPPVQREVELNLSIDSKIQQFIAEATISFNSYFSKMDLSTDAQALPATQTSSEESWTDPPVCSSCGISADSVHEALSTNAPSEVLPSPEYRLPLAVPLQVKPLVQQVAMVPAMPASQPVVVTKPVPQLYTKKTSLSPPLAVHVCKELRETVVSLQYFNMFALLSGQTKHAFASQNLMVGIHGTIFQWRKGFAIMGSILLEDAPEKMKGFFNYGETIHTAYTQENSKGWLNYDEKFRKLKEDHPELGWDTIDSELWQQLLSEPVAVVSSVRAPPTKARKASFTKVMDRGNCWLYDKDQCHMGSRCHYYHVCSNCEGEHPKIYCPMLNPATDGPPLKRTR